MKACFRPRRAPQTCSQAHRDNNRGQCYWCSRHECGARAPCVACDDPDSLVRPASAPATETAVARRRSCCRNNTGRPRCSPRNALQDPSSATSVEAAGKTAPEADDRTCHPPIKHQTSRPAAMVPAEAEDHARTAVHIRVTAATAAARRRACCRNNTGAHGAHGP